MEKKNTTEQTLAGAPVNIIKTTRDRAGYLYVEVASGDAKALKGFLDGKGYSCVNDMTYVDAKGKPTGTRLLSFIEWNGSHK